MPCYSSRCLIPFFFSTLICASIHGRRGCQDLQPVKPEGSGRDYRNFEEHPASGRRLCRFDWMRELLCLAATSFGGFPPQVSRPNLSRAEGKRKVSEDVRVSKGTYSGFCKVHASLRHDKGSSVGRASQSIEDSPHRRIQLDVASDWVQA